MPKRLLFVDGNPEELQELRSSLGGMMQEWEMEFASAGADALGLLKIKQFDAIVADMQLSDMTGAQLVSEVAKQYSNTVRFIRANPNDKELVARSVQGIHQFLPKPCEPEALKLSLSRALAIDVWLTNPQIRTVVGRIRTFPSLPSIYTAVLRELKSPDSSTDKVGELIGKDLAMTTKILQMLNSAFYGLPRQISDLGEAIGILGLDTVKSLVLGIQLFSQYDKVKPVFFSIDRLWKHSTFIAKSAREITLFETKDETLADEAYTAGLLHDIGKMVLVSNFDEQYHGAQSLARKNGMSLWEVERELFGVSHSEIGAYLLGLWGMPLGLLEAAALHHEPSRCPNKFFCPLTAVHAANALAYELQPENDSLVPPALDTGYLANLSLAGHLDFWRDMMANRKLATESTAGSQSAPHPQAEVPAQTPVAAPPAGPEPIAESGPGTEPLSNSGLERWLSWRQPWVYLAALLLLVLIVVFAQLWPNRPREEASALAPVATNAEASVAPPQPRAVPAQPPEAPAVAKAPATLPPLQTNAAAPQTRRPPNEQEFPALRLQGITYQVSNPSALINGETVFVGTVLGGARVTAIDADRVTLEYGGRRKVLSLP